MVLKKGIKVLCLCGLYLSVFLFGMLSYYTVYRIKSARGRTVAVSAAKIMTKKVVSSKHEPDKKGSNNKSDAMITMKKNDKRMKTEPIYSKEAYLTIDDGPSAANTEKILNILNENGVKATFFLIGKNVDANPGLVKEEYDDGMCVLPHSYYHDYAKVYKSVDDYMQDLNLCINSIKKATGAEVLPFTRFPGGSDNEVSYGNMKAIREAVMGRGIDYIDWNVSSADAAPYYVEPERIVNNIVSESQEKNMVVILMHDAADKKSSVEALPVFLKELKAQGFVFRTFNDITPEEKQMMTKIRVMDR